jgi:membrane-bound metal-dependent hydrolase YbcI (DUF457 family)
MAGFRTHIGASTIVGIGYGTAGYIWLQLSPPVAVVSAGLCAIAGILPDVDSDSGKPVQEVMGFAAAVIPLLLLEQLRQRGLERDSLVAAGVGTYLVVRFGLGGLLRRCTVHRGMWHSLPAVAIAAMVTAFICVLDSPLDRWFKVGAVALGYLVHLILDEIWSIDLRRGRVRLKKSSGSALKIWGEGLGANVFAFANLALLSYLLLYQPMHWPVVMNEQLPDREAYQHAIETDPSELERR